MAQQLDNIKCLLSDDLLVEKRPKSEEGFEAVYRVLGCLQLSAGLNKHIMNLGRKSPCQALSIKCAFVA